MLPVAPPFTAYPCKCHHRRTRSPTIPGLSAHGREPSAATSREETVLDQSVGKDDQTPLSRLASDQTLLPPLARGLPHRCPAEAVAAPHTSPPHTEQLTGPFTLQPPTPSAVAAPAPSPPPHITHPPTHSTPTPAEVTLYAQSRWRCCSDGARRGKLSKKASETATPVESMDRVWKKYGCVGGWVGGWGWVGNRGARRTVQHERSAIPPRETFVAHEAQSSNTSTSRLVPLPQPKSQKGERRLVTLRLLRGSELRPKLCIQSFQQSM